MSCGPRSPAALMNTVGALEIKWTVRVMPNWAKMAGFYTPVKISHCVWGTSVSLYKMIFLQLSQSLEGLTVQS